jgi:hypothetical protein
MDLGSPDPTTIKKEEKMFVLPFFTAMNLSKFKIIYFFRIGVEKILVILQRIKVFLTQKNGY